MLILRSAVVILSLISLLYSTSVRTANTAETICSSPATLFCEDFESGQVGPWTGSDWQLTTAEKFSGNSSLDMTYGALPRPGDNGGSGFVTVDVRLPSPCPGKDFCD